MPIQEPEVERGASRDPCAVRHHDLEQFESLARHATVLLGTRVFESRRAQELFDRLRGAVHHDDVALADDLAACRARETRAASDHAEQVDIVLIRHGLQLAQLHTNRLGCVAHAPFSDVAPQVHQLLGAVESAPLDRDQSPTDERDVGDPHDRHDETDRREVEHAVGGSERLLPERSR